MNVLIKCDTRVFLWLMFCVQIFLIAMILGFGSFFTQTECIGNCTGVASSSAVQFISHAGDEPTKTTSGHQEIRLLSDASAVLQFPPRLAQDMFSLSQVPERNTSIWCFKEGSVPKGDTEFHTEIDEKGAARCKCKAEWHGRDCGQPEVVWRAVFASKSAVTTDRRPKRIYHIIRTTEHSLETLEVQLMELMDVVHVFAVCVQNASQTVGVTKVRRHLEKNPQLKANSQRIFLKWEKKNKKWRRRCSSKDILREMEESLGWRIEEEDVVMLSDQDEILNRKAVNYLRWYLDGHDLIRFRMKHVMYGFFWQHPQKTILRSVAVRYKLLVQSLHSLEDLSRVENTSQLGNLMVIGGLNHFGGWYCQLCYHPLDIINYLVDEMRANETVRGRHKNGVIDEEFVTKLIANGVNIYELLAREGNFEKAQILGGGPMDLTKLYPSAEKYYSPLYVHQNHQRFENIVRNPFSRWDLDAVDDYNYYD